MTCAIMNKLRRISAPARHRLVFDLRIPLFGKAEFLQTSTFREIGVVGSRQTQPLFTRLATSLQNKASASKHTVRRSQAPARQHAEMHARSVFFQQNRHQISITRSLHLPSTTTNIATFLSA